METSTNDVGHGLQLNTEGSESVRGDLIMTTEHPRDGGDTNLSALPNGNVLFFSS